MDGCLLHLGMADHHAACVFESALQGQHQCVAVDDAGAGGVQCRRTVQRGLHGTCLGAFKPAQVVDAIGLGLACNGLELAALRLIRCHDELATALMGNAAFTAVGVETLPAFDAQTGFQRTFGIVNAGVDDLAVARAGARANGFSRLQHHDLPALQRQRPGHRQPHHARTHHHAIDLFAHLVCPFTVQQPIIRRRQTRMRHRSSGRIGISRA